MGPYTQALIEANLAAGQVTEQAFRRCFGTLRLCQDFGRDTLERACKLALERKSFATYSVKRLARRVADDMHSAPQLSIEHENLRGPDYFTTNQNKMLLHPLLEKLDHLRLRGMAAALREQLNTPEIESMPFMDRLGLMVDHEEAVRGDRRLARRLQTAQLRLQASMANLDYKAARGLDKRLMLHLASCQWIRRQQNVIITGPTGVGKSYVACALAHKACLENFKTRYIRLSRFLETIQMAREEGTYLNELKQLARMGVLVLDDWGLHRINPTQQRDLMELLDDRYTVRSTIVTSQTPLEKWYEIMEDATLADAIMDRLVNNAHKINLSGESMRKVQGQQEFELETYPS